MEGLPRDRVCFMGLPTFGGIPMINDKKAGGGNSDVS